MATFRHVIMSRVTSAPARTHDAETLLQLVESAFRQVTDGPADRRVPGVRNMLVFGGLYTTLIEAIASGNKIFASWLDVQKVPDGVEALRRLILRAAKGRRDFTQVQVASAGTQFGPRPKNARVFFTADRLGGSGYEIELPGGGVEKYYLTLPDNLPNGYSFDDTGINAETLMRRYAAHLREMMRHLKIALPPR